MSVHSTACQHVVSSIINLSLRTFGATSDLSNPSFALPHPQAAPAQALTQTPVVGQSVRHLWEPSPTEVQKKGSNGQQRVVRKYLAWRPVFSNVPWAQKFHWQLSIKSHFYFLCGIYGLVMQYQYMPMVSIYTTMYFQQKFFHALTFLA